MRESRASPLSHSTSMRERLTTLLARARRQLRDQRRELRFPDVAVHVADALVHDHAARIDEKRLRCAVHAEVDAERAVPIEDLSLVRIAEAIEPRSRGFRIVLVDDADQRNA